MTAGRPPQQTQSVRVATGSMGADMPLIVVTLLGAVLTGLWLPRRAAFAATAALSVVTLVAFVWAVSDGKGNDPWWLVLLAVAACGFAVGVVAFLSRRRLQSAVRL
jgi:hypothetical protein